MKHKIILPELLDIRERANFSPRMISLHANCLLALPAYDENISVVCSNELLTPYVAEMLKSAPDMANKNGQFSGMFVVNDKVFMSINTDAPVTNHEQWVPYFSKYISGFFVACRRTSTEYIFAKCETPVFSMTFSPAVLMPTHYLEHTAHSKSMTCKKDIPVFFRGRYRTRKPRKFVASIIQENFPDSYIQDIYLNGSISGYEYIDLMSRSKIVWCPRSVWSPPEHDCNAVTGKETEAMCLEVMVIKHPIGIIEVEKRISGVHFVEMRNDSSDIIEKLHYYLEHDDERKEIAHNGRLWYERNCSILGRAKQIFQDCLTALGNKENYWDNLQG